MIKRILSIILTVMIIVSMTMLSISSVSAADVTQKSSADTSADSEQSRKIYFQVPDNWNNVTQMWAHIYMSIDDGSAKWPTWKTRAEKMADEGNGLWSYEVEVQTGNTLDPAKGAAYTVIFVNNNDMQTYNLIFGADCLGDTAYVTGNTFENPADSGKSCIEAVWKSGKYGPEKQILSTGKGVVGDILPEGSTDAMLMATWLRAYYGDRTKTKNIPILLEELNVTPEEVYDAFVELVNNYEDEYKEYMLDIVYELLFETEYQYGVESIEVIKVPDRTEFIVGNEYYIFDCLSGMEVKVTYVDGTSAIYNYDDNWDLFHYELEYSGESVNYGWFTPIKGENIIIVTCGKKSVDFTVTGIEVENVEVIKLPDKTEFIVGNEYYIFSYLDGMEVKVTYADGTRVVYNFDDNGDFFFDNLYFCDENGEYSWITPVKGENIITVICGGKSTKFTITGIEVENIEVTRLPDNKFLVGDEYYIPHYLDGMEVKITYSNGTTAIYNYDEDQYFFYNEAEYFGESVEYGLITPIKGENVIIISCGGKSAEFTITGVDIEGIEITELPNKTEFIVGNEYYLTNYLDGMEVKVIYSDGTFEVYNSDDNWRFFCYELEYSGECVEYDEYDNLIFVPKLGKNTIIISYQEKTVDYTFEGLEVESIEVTKLPAGKFIVGEIYWLPSYLDGMEVVVTYTNGTSYTYNRDDNWDFFYYELEFTGKCFGEYDEFIPVLGENAITVTCGGKSSEFIIEGVEVTNIEVTKSSDKKFIAGTKYYISPFEGFFEGVEIKVSYSDGTDEVHSYSGIDDIEDWEFFYRLEFSGDCVYSIYDKYNVPLSAVVFDNYIIPVLGENVITITYYGKSTELIIIGVNAELGDVDGDGELNVKDATAIQMYLAGYSEINLDVADYNGDGVVDVKDVTAIQMTLAGF